MKQYRRYFPRVRIRSTVFIFITVLITTIIYVPLSSVQDKTKNLKRVYLIQTNKKQIQGHIYVNQRDDMLTKTRN
jgi:hypothetical protein